jgi:hypothetical protein
MEEVDDSLAGVRSNELLKRNALVTQFLFGCKYNVDDDLMSPLYVHSESDNFFGAATSLSCDVDSFAYVGDHIPVRAPFGLVFRSRYDLSYKSSRGVMWSHPDYTANVEVGVNKVPNFHFMKSDRINVGYTYTDRLCRF